MSRGDYSGFMREYKESKRNYLGLNERMTGQEILKITKSTTR